MSNPVAAPQTALEKQATATANVGTILKNNQVFIEILREDRAKQDEMNLSLRLANRNAKDSLEVSNAKIKELQDIIAHKDKDIKELREVNVTQKTRLEGVQWYLGKVANQDVTQEYLKEVHEIYLAELEERRIRANKRSVAKSHEEMEREAELARKDEADARNVVMRKQAELKAQLENTAVAAQETNPVKEELDDTVSKFVPYSKDEVDIDIATVDVDDELADPPAQIQAEPVESASSVDEEVEGVEKEERPSLGSSHFHHRVKKKKR